MVLDQLGPLEAGRFGYSMRIGAYSGRERDTARPFLGAVALCGCDDFGLGVWCNYPTILFWSISVPANVSSQDCHLRCGQLHFIPSCRPVVFSPFLSGGTVRRAVVGCVIEFANRLLQTSPLSLTRRSASKARHIFASHPQK